MSDSVNAINASSYTTTGYTCLTCGSWVTEGSLHYCAFRQQPAYTTYTWPMIDTSGIVAELAAIRAVMEKLLDKMSESK
jgi:hypothetical protein